MEHLGVRTTVVFRPGHAFTLVWVGEGPSDFVPIECTAITPLAVGAKNRVPFEDAVKMAQQDLQNQRIQIWLGVQQYQAQGFRSPELPAVEIDKIKNILARRPVRGSGGGGGGQIVRTPAAQEELPEGFIKWEGAEGQVSVGVPSHWPRMENSPVPGVVFSAQDMQTSVAVNVFHYPKLQSAKDAMQTAQRGIASVAGAKASVASTKQDGKATIYSGGTRYPNGSEFVWVTVFQPSSEGVVGYSVGAEKSVYQRQLKMIQTLIKYAHIGE
jgi:hypothetical protein